MSRRTWTENDLKMAVANAICYSDVIRHLGLVPRGGNFKSIKSAIQKAGLDVSHFDFSKACARGNDKTAIHNRIPPCLMQTSWSTSATTQDVCWWDRG